MKINKVIDVSRGDEKLSHYLESGMKVLLVFFHGIGDCIMFKCVFSHIRKIYPDIDFDIGLCKGLDQEFIYPEAVLLDADWREKFDTLGYDIVMSCNFPMNEAQDELTKSEWCCEKELGIPPVSGHFPLRGGNKLIGIHYNITCLPDACNPTSEVAEKIWNETLAAGFFPVETHFEHIFHNPVNKKFDFVNFHVRSVQPRISLLAGLLESCYACICVVSGNFHMALSVKDHTRVCLLEKDFKRGSFTKLPIQTIDIKDYKDGSVLEWLASIS